MMLKQLRFKIVMINVGIVGFVLFLVFTAICVGSYRTSRDRLEAGLRIALQSERGEMPDVPVIGTRGEEKDRMNALPSYVSVTLDDSGIIEKASRMNVSIEDSVLQIAVDEAVSRSDECAIISDMDLIYFRQYTPDGMKLAFADTGGITGAVRDTVISSVTLFIICIAVLVCISILLSSLAVKPVERAWIQQKQFVADASHELKTPLTVILANNNIIMSHADQTVNSQRQWLEGSEEEAVRMKTLIDQMLILAKSDAEQRSVNFESVNVSELLNETALCLEPLSYDKGVTLECDIAPGVTVSSERAMLARLVQILMDNAIKYAAPGTAVTLKLTPDVPHEITVRDYGIVISEDELPYIFDRFYRADRARSEGGFGLGLAIAKQCADTIHARLSVTSSESDGTVFRIRL